MKKMILLLIVLLALCLVLPANAQINLGALGGLNLAKIDYEPLEEGIEISYYVDFGIGVVLDCRLNKSISLLLEPLYLKKGVKAEDLPWQQKWEFNLAYLEIPMMLKYSFTAKNIKPYVMAGPSIGFNRWAKAKVSWEGHSDVWGIKWGTKSIDYGISFGAGVNVPMGNISILVETRYTLGLTNINDGGFPDSDAVVKTKGIQIFCGFTFPLINK